MRRRTRSVSLDSVLGTIGLGFVLLAVVRELRRPPGLRAWHGTVLGVVPYDFRRPTLARLRDTWWSPDDGRLLMPRVLGVGWSVNLAHAVQLLRQGRRGTARASHPGPDRAA
jgi:hypothetical protein